MEDICFMAEVSSFVRPTSNLFKLYVFQRLREFRPQMWKIGEKRMHEIWLFSQKPLVLAYTPNMPKSNFFECT